jgi:hypothetical protein
MHAVCIASKSFFYQSGKCRRQFRPREARRSDVEQHTVTAMHNQFTAHAFGECRDRRFTTVINMTVGIDYFELDT